MRRLLTHRTCVLLLIAAVASATFASEGQRLTYSLPRHIPYEAADLYGDLVALRSDVAGVSTVGALVPGQRGWTSHVTSHFVLLTDAGAAWCVQAGRTLEQTRAAFYQAFNTAGFAIAPLDDRLVWVAFTRRDDFHQYALNVDRLDMSWSDGYYSTRTNRVALVCDGAERGHGHAIAHASDSTEMHPQPSEGFTHLAQTTHEAVHQIAFNCGLQKRGVMYPLWASEGLATNFEAVAGAPFGPDHDNPHRRRQLVRALGRDGLLPLNDFIVLTRVPVDDAGATHDVYAQSWAFFRFLYQHRPQQLRRYLEDLRGLDPGRRDAATLRREFVRAFGRVDSLDRSWQAYLRLLARPVTAGEP
jgi:hypothetical protein